MKANIVETKIYNITPGYLAKYDEMIKGFTQFGGGAKEEKYVQGKAFSNTYEFYMYAFFLGLYKNNVSDLHPDDELKKFWKIEDWKPREMADHLLACALTKSDFDMVAVENYTESEVAVEVRKLKSTIESYANGGFDYIYGIIEGDSEGDTEIADDFFIKQLA